MTDDDAVAVVEGTEQHASEVMAVWESVGAEGKWIGTEPPLRPGWRDRYRASLVDPASAWFVALDAGRVVGALSVRHSAGVAALGMAIIDSHRGQGIGRVLLDCAVGWAREQDCHKVNLEVWPHNERARRLYRAAGFAEEGIRRREHRRRNGELWDSVAMGLVLDTSSPGCRFGPE